MSAVEARFYVSGYERNAWDQSQTIVKMQAVSRGEHNKSWAAATPAGQVQMTIKNESAARWFVDKLGQEVSVVFTPVEDGNVYRDEHGPASVS